MSFNYTIRVVLGFLMLVVFLPAAGSAQPYDTTYYNAMEFRSIGPYRGGRSAAATGVPGQPMMAYFGATGGGVWKSTTGGASWENISDGYFGGSIGAVAVSTWDSNVIYVGGGEKTVRGNVSHGYGIYKSLDAGRTWEHKGLSDSHRIPRIRIHPRNPDHVYAAVLGHLSGPNDERGIYRSMDGGESWERILFISDEVGFVDLAMDPSNPRVLYASAWRVIRTPYSLESGGEGSGIWKSTDGGDTWSEVTGQDNGLPRGTLGISGIAISPVNPDRIWVIIEAAEGGVFRSDNGGETWRKINDDRNLRQRAWYYTRIYADTANEDVVYVLNVQFWRSKDGGSTYSSISTPHGDHHDLWINPDDSNHLIIADDGGAQVSFDAGDNWSTYYNQPTAQFYRVTTDNHFPYRILGAQQDNSTVRILHTTSGLNEREWEPTAGGESGWLAPKPDNPQIVYGGSYGGYLTRVDHDTGERRAVNVYPDNPMGHGAEGMHYRFQWNFPILFSKHDYNVLYAAGNHLFRTTNEGQSWEMVSTDLTRADSTKLGPSGGPITKDNTGVEYYATIFTVAESPHDPQVLWAGSDDGLVHITRDGGATWEDITPEGMPEWMQVNDLVAHPTMEGGAYFAGTRYKLDDFAPYIYKTTNYGAGWELIVDGIDEQHFTRAIQPDPVRHGLLWAGTESGLYISFDDGENWSQFQQNLPIVPITDLDWKDNDLIVATQGRSFWVMDDVTPLHQLSDTMASKSMWLYDSAPTWRTGGSVSLRYWFKEAPDSSTTKLRILESDGTIIKTFSAEDGDLDIEAGMNVFNWNTRYEDAESFSGLIMWAGSVRGPRAAPGTYRTRLIAGDDSLEVTFELRKDPRSSSSVADLQEQFDFLIGIRDKLTETHEAIKEIRELHTQIRRITGNMDEEHAAITDSAKALIQKITEIEETLYQTKNQSRQDPLNFPIRLNNKLAAVGGNASIGDFRPTDQAIEVRDNLVMLIDAELEKLQSIMETDVPALNAMIRQANIPAISSN
ncbi:MAG: glycosyl hydrolase [Rhodothermaceae bacterium]|nr:glycosyl hydrolase [Rhodothermaceae bacterium]MYD20536.1 glycosyl hydrolase [Rhodothermaceae bacterium]MYD57850.1 glycosyl hydrolase [Rhodothermaceae bacterium]MYJ20835.1 glycosyl hydrolase [Rhodothermaceae bacterium]MYJ57124.1 glycosyl hydrolase [Rhodothermaceae bacterium]